MGTLAELFLREAGLVEEFIAVLKEEQEALKRGDVSVLAAINARKSSLVAGLNEAEGGRNAILKPAGCSADRAGMRAWLAKNPSDRAAVREWGKLMKLAAEAKEINRLNGQLIALRLQATNQALSALARRSQRSALYGPDGQTAQLTGSRIIDAA